MSWLSESVPFLVAIGWLVRMPGVSREEGHEAITRAAWEGMELSVDQQRGLIRGVRAPDVSLAGLVASVLPFAQRRHALRSWSGSTTTSGVRDVREFLAATHLRAVAPPDGHRRWAAFGELLHCLQDSYSPAHIDRVDGQIVRMKHWGPLDLLRHGRTGDEHGFPADRRDRPWSGGKLTEEAVAAVAASRRYLEIATRAPGLPGEFEAFLDDCCRATPARASRA